MEDFKSSVGILKSREIELNQDDDSHGESTAAKNEDLTESNNSDCVHAYHHTTDGSKLLVVVFELQSKYGGHAWYFQPRLLADLLYFYGVHSLTEKPDVSEAFVNMKAGAVPDSLDSNKQLVTSLSLESSHLPKEGSLFHKHYHMYTMIPIPYYQLGYGLNEEVYRLSVKHWIGLTIQAIVGRMQEIFISEKFQLLYTRLADQDPCRDTAIARQPKQHSTLPAYIKNASIQIHPVTLLTKHFTRSLAISISQQISDKRLPCFRYPRRIGFKTTKASCRNSKETPPQKRAKHAEECNVRKPLLHQIQEVTNHFTQPESTTIMNQSTNASYPSLQLRLSFPKFPNKQPDDHDSSNSEHDGQHSKQSLIVASLGCVLPTQSKPMTKSLICRGNTMD